MKKFIKKILYFSIATITLVSIILLFNFLIVGNQYTHSYQASITDKLDRLHTINSPKIVLIGNSNLAFGINSNMIEKNLQIPVVNLGLHGGLGDIFLANMIKGHVSKGDIIIYAPTNFGNTSTRIDSELAWATIEKNLYLWKLIPQDNYETMAYGIRPYIYKTTINFLFNLDKPITKDIYSRSSFNKYGDVYTERKNKYTMKPSDILSPSISQETILRINELNKYIKNSGGTLLIAANPIITSTKYPQSKPKYLKFQQELINHLDCPVISTYTDYFIDEKYFFDGRNHLTTEGSNIRTNQLIKDLMLWKQQQNY